VKIILSLDGGGIRGAATAQFLSRIEDHLNTQHLCSLRDLVHFYAGTSTGSIIALALGTTQLSIKEICDLYSFSSAQAIFSRPSFKNLRQFALGPKYSGKSKYEFLRNKFAGAQLAHTHSNTHVLAVTYSLKHRIPVIFKSSDPMTAKLLSADIADASSAAPTYFPSKKIALSHDTEDWFIDGGVIANDPTMCAIAEAKRQFSAPLHQIGVISVGTGFQTRAISYQKSHRWGKLGWLKSGDIMGVLTDEKAVEYQAKTIMPCGHFIRVNSELKTHPNLPLAAKDEMDCITPENIRRLKLLGDFWFEQYGEKVIRLLLGKTLERSLGSIDTEKGEPTPYIPQQ